MTRLRILMTVDAVGGVWQYATELARALVPLGHEVVLALLGPPASEDQLREIEGVDGITLIGIGRPLDWLADDEAAVRETAEAVAALAAEVGADIVQFNQPALAIAPLDVPVVAVAHSCVASWWDSVEGGDLPARFVWQTRLVRDGLAAADEIVCPSRAFAVAVRDTYHLLNLPTVVHNGRASPTGRTGAMHDFALTAGRLWDKGKNVATLDRAAARLTVPFKAAGPLAGPHGEAVEVEHLHALGLLPTAELAACMLARPVFVSAARYEPFGLAVLEAALAGCPLVLSDIATFRELWDGVASFVAPTDARGFADAIDALIADEGARRAAGDRARAHAARYMPAAMAGEMASLYRRLHASASVGAGHRPRVAA